MDLSLFEQFFHISTHGAETPAYSVSAVELLQSIEQMERFLQTGSELVQGIGLELAVSFGGLAFFGLIVTKQLIMSQYNRILDLSLDNLTVQLETHNDHAHIVLKIHELRWTELPSEQRSIAFIAEWKTYFNETINPMIEQITRVACFKPDLIWNQFGSRMAYMIDYVSERTPAGSISQRIEDDFALLTGLAPETFNRKRKNPFHHTPCYIDSPYEPGKQLMIRSACCMYYKRENGVKCYNCPILKEEDRTNRRLEIEADIARKAAQKHAAEA